MLIGLLGFIVFSVVFNAAFYEFRVIKGLFKEPKYITKSYSNFQLMKRYK
jgi:hypothetical protein